MKDYPWDYIEWILENSSQCGIGGGHGGEEDYISYIVFCCPMLEDFTGLGLCCLFMCFIKYKDFPYVQLVLFIHSFVVIECLDVFPLP